MDRERDVARMITVAVKDKGKALHVVVGEVDDRDGWFTAECGFQAFSAASFSAPSVEDAEVRLPWPLCRPCLSRLRKQAS